MHGICIGEVRCQSYNIGCLELSFKTAVAFTIVELQDGRIQWSSYNIYNDPIATQFVARTTFHNLFMAILCMQEKRRYDMSLTSLTFINGLPEMTLFASRHGTFYYYYILLYNGNQRWWIIDHYWAHVFHQLEKRYFRISICFCSETTFCRIIYVKAKQKNVAMSTRSGNETYRWVLDNSWINNRCLLTSED